jgi:hypothetical protein
VFVDGTDTLTVEGTALSPSSTISLEKGWNLIPFYPAGEMPVEDAFQSISGVVEIVKDEVGNSYVPDRNLNEIGTLEPGRAYKVYVESETSFSYP